jgi:hypothetical protein
MTSDRRPDQIRIGHDAGNCPQAQRIEERHALVQAELLGERHQLAFAASVAIDVKSGVRQLALQGRKGAGRYIQPLVPLQPTRIEDQRAARPRRARLGLKDLPVDVVHEYGTFLRRRGTRRVPLEPDVVGQDDLARMTWSETPAEIFSTHFNERTSSDWTCLEKVESFPWMKGELDDEAEGIWIARNRDREIGAPEKARSEDMTAELKRLRRQNEILRQERDILKKATAFFARERSR